MSNRNNGDSSAAIAFGVIGMAAVGIMILFVGVAGFATFVMTILCLVAWNKPLQLGKWSIEPQEARAFVVRGLIGAALIPAFILFADLMFGLEIDWRYWHYFALGGYIGGSLGVELAIQQAGASAPVAQPPQPLPPSLPNPKPVEQHSFEFARWDDEEDQR